MSLLPEQNEEAVQSKNRMMTAGAVTSGTLVVIEKSHTQQCRAFPSKQKSTWLSSFQCCENNNGNTRKMSLSSTKRYEGTFSALNLSNNAIFTEKTIKK